MGFEYKIKQENDNLDEVVIEKNNITAEFTLGDINEEQEALKKYLKEFKANLDVKKAAIENIESFHPFVKDYDDKKLFTIALYQDNKVKAKQYEEGIAKFTKQLEESESEVLEIIKQIGLKPSQVETLSDNKSGNEEDK